MDSSLSLQNFSYLKSINADYIEELYQKFLEDPSSVDESWRYFFEGVYLGEMSALENAVQNGADATAENSYESKIQKLVEAYRNHGHRYAKLNPLSDSHSPSFEWVKPSQFGLDENSVSAITQELKNKYCGSLGIEFLQLQNPVEREWLEKKIDSLNGKLSVDVETKKFILNRLTASEALERFIHTRYVAQKRFSIEGGEALIPGLDAVIETAAQFGAEEVVMGMAHRGRLNVLINTFRKKPEALFSEFDDNYPLSTEHGEGDVKYHKGYSYDHTTRDGKKVHLSMGFNPSHLEFINPVVMGMAKAKQYLRNDSQQSKVMSVLMHGDAAFAGQGVVYETLQASLLKSYGVGGTLHIISNNQVGFTTDPSDSRSTRYCTDLARMLDAPIFHVNGDDPEALWIAVKIATEFRYQFKKDVFIDLICYRKYGHNEGDEPAFTQPVLYQSITKHTSPREVYANRLVQEGVVSGDYPKAEFDAATEPLSQALEKVRTEKPQPPHSEYEGPVWSKYHAAHGDDMLQPVETQVSESEVKRVSQFINTFPDSFKVHPKLARLFEGRIQAVENGKGIDWGNAEVLAYATLIAQGRSVRMSGQDVKRGTFTHRHAAVFDHRDGKELIRANELHSQAKFLIYNSHLSETAAMGFEYGWSVTDPDSLVVWEAQFGDFANGAQVMIDQFIATSESKWHRANGLTLLLPHGFEGQGPEHSSARLERFLQLCGRNNMSVCYPTTPAQIFHLLRRQVLRKFRKPLVVMTPKSLLRHPKAISDLTDLSQNNFQEVLDDPMHSQDRDSGSSKNVKRIMIVSGKIYYDLLEERENRKSNHIALVRMEQLYPWPGPMLAKVLQRYSNAKELFFVQEEPRNMGAWMYFQGHWMGGLSNFGSQFAHLGLTYVGRDVCASPAVGSKKLHDHEQKQIVMKAFQD